jgi:transposase-like protein
MKGEELEETVKQDLEARIRQGIKALFEQILEEEMTEHLGAAPSYQRSPTRRGQRNGGYERDLVTGVGTIHQLRVPRDREGTFQTELFERYRRLTGSVEEAVLEMYLQGVSTRKVAAVTDALAGKRVGKDAVSRITARLQQQVQAWRKRRLTKEYVSLSLDATYLKANWGGRVVSVALLVAVGVNRQGYRELLAVEAAPKEQAPAWQSLLRGLVDRGLQGVQLVISDDHEAIKAAVAAELPQVAWQRCVVHFERNVLAQVPHHAKAEVACDLKAIFAVRRRQTAEALAQQFLERWGADFPKAVEVFEAGIADALTYLDFPSGHHSRIRTTNGLERLFEEIKRRTRVVGVFPDETSLVTLTTTVAVRATEEWALRRYLDMSLLEAHEKAQVGASQFTQLSRR